MHLYTRLTSGGGGYGSRTTKAMYLYTKLTSVGRGQQDYQSYVHVPSYKIDLGWQGGHHGYVPLFILNSLKESGKYSWIDLENHGTVREFLYTSSV